MPPLGPFDLKTAARVSGLSASMVDYLCRTGIVRPSASRYRSRGKKRLYTFADIVMLSTIKRLLNKGVSVMRLKDAIKTLRKRYAAITPDFLPAQYLVTDGKWVLFKSPDTVLEELNRGGQFAFSFVVDMKSVHQDVLAKINFSQE